MKLSLLKLGFLAAVGAMMNLPSATSGQIITTAGSDIDVAQTQLPNGVQSNDFNDRAIVDYWRTTSVVKPNDIDGDNVLGTDGYRYVGDGQLTDIQNSDPSYATLSNLTSTLFDGNNGYAQIDDGNFPSGVFVVRQDSGTFNPGSTTAAEGVFVSFGTIGFNRNALLGETVRIGLMVDNLNDTNFNSGLLRLTEGIGGAATDVNVFAGTGSNVTLDRGNRNPDWYFFDVTDFASGDQIEVLATSSFGNGSTSTPATIGAFSFDSVVTAVPEPSSASLLALSGIALLLRRRK